MVEQFLATLENVISTCVGWVGSLFEATGATGVVLAAFSLGLAISLLFIPMRGRMNFTSSFNDYTSQRTHNKSKKKKD